MPPPSPVCVVQRRAMRPLKAAPITQNPNSDLNYGLNDVMPVPDEAQ